MVPEYGYSFVAAANLYTNYAGNLMYVKYVKRKEPGVHIKTMGKNHIWYVTPDREIVFVRDAFANESFCPNESFDLCVDLNTFNDTAARGLGLEYVMTNYTHDTHCVRTPINRRELPPERKISQLLSDSGGLQVIREQLDFIDPRKLIEFYNNTVDAGMVLDLPLLVRDEKLAKRAAHVQRRCNEVMLANRKPGVELINIFHGTTVEDRKRYREIVEDTRIERVAIGGLLRMSLVTAVNTIYELLQGYRYKQYHALGVFVLPYVVLLVKIANSGEQPPHITSDSTSHIQSSMNAIYMHQLHNYNPMSRTPIGTNSGVVHNSHSFLPCTCAMCRNVKYNDIFAFGPNRFAPFLSIHNAIEMARYTSSLQYACRSMTPREYNKYVVHQLRDARDRHELGMALDFIDIASQDGLKKAQTKYKNHIGKWALPDKQAPSLFDVGAEPSVDWKAVTTRKLGSMEKLLNEIGVK